MKKILGIGNALVDIIIRIDDDRILSNLDLPKGSMQLVDKNRSEKVLSSTSHFKREIRSGGSAANTITGLSELGMSTSFIAKITDDQMGEVFKTDLLRSNIGLKLQYSTTGTGTAVTLISNDSERTFATHLGASVELSANDLSDKLFEGADLFYIEGYLVQNHELLEKAVSLAKSCNQKIFLDLASYNVVEENIEFLEHILKNYVDVVFANEEEAKAFTGKMPEEAIGILADSCEIAVVKTGSKGSLILANNELTKVGVIKANSIDTTGAGDLYAAGFIYGYAHGANMETCGKLGSLLSGKVIENIGAKINPETWPGLVQMAKSYIM